MTDDKSDSTEIVQKTADNPTALERMWGGLIELAKDETVQPEKLTALLDAQRGMLNDQREQEYSVAMANARADMPVITRDGAIRNKQGQVQSRYATFDAIDRIVKPIAAKHGLDYGFNLEGDQGGRMMVTCEVTHIGDHGAITKKFGPMPLALDQSGSKNATQGAGSSSSYGKRYTLCAAFNIRTDGEDDDGQSGGGSRGEALQISGLDLEGLLHEARQAATGGLSAYEKWFKAQTGLRRGWLMDEGHHASLKASAEEIGR